MMLMLVPLAGANVVGRVGTSVVLCGEGNSFGSKLAGTIADSSSSADFRRCSSPVLEWEGLKDVS